MKMKARSRSPSELDPDQVNVVAACAPPLRAAYTVEVGVEVVWDHGPGVDEAALPRLTDRFFRAAPSQASGSGLGLAIVRTLAEAQGGQFGLSNRSGGRSGLVGRLTFQPSAEE